MYLSPLIVDYTIREFKSFEDSTSKAVSTGFILKYSDEIISLSDEKLDDWIRSEYSDSLNNYGSGTISILIADLENFICKNPDCEEREQLENDIKTSKEKGDIYIDYDLF